MFKVESTSFFEFSKVRPKFAALLVAIGLFHLPNLSIASEGFIEEVIVTAQKREQSINDVGMSIDVSSGEKLSDLGITDAFDLGKVVSGFNANSNYYGSMVYTLRGIGFQDTALAST